MTGGNTRTYQDVVDKLLMPLARFCGKLVAIPGVKLRLDPRVPVQ